MGIISWIVLGGLVGWVASMIMRKNASMGVLANIIVGIIGAFIGGFIMNLIGKYGITGFNIKSFLVALVGAVVLLAIINLIRKGKVR
ncbi:MAG: GlsB/YeaQ/YmgE family stress response membrane protein [Clostridia bacterium]|nr:GlsB/YeaQ/YmgE family stress response membrane protein [Clostridia bacterium]MDD4572228.1 GlsB/YeaQ/YmgE family stress response membrane protein [Clostridia bacterium]